MLRTTCCCWGSWNFFFCLLWSLNLSKNSLPDDRGLVPGSERDLLFGGSGWDCGTDWDCGTGWDCVASVVGVSVTATVGEDLGDVSNGEDFEIASAGEDMEIASAVEALEDASAEELWLLSLPLSFCLRCCVCFLCGWPGPSGQRSHPPAP